MAAPYRTPAKRQLSAVTAGVLSLGLHGALLGVVVLKNHVLPPLEELTSQRLGGQTFDVDSLGAPSDDEVAAPSPPPAAVPADLTAEKAEHPPVEEPTEPSPPAIAPDSPEVPKATPLETPTEEIPPPPTQAPRTEPLPQPKKQNPEPRVDPFDMGQLPGEATQAEALPSGSDAEGSPKEGAYGAAGVESTVVDVFAAFLRQIPLAAKSDPTWTHLPFGDAGRIEFVLTVSKEGRLGPIQIIEDARFPSPAHMKRVLPLAARFLEHARVSFHQTAAGGSQRLAITAVVHRRAPDKDRPEAEGVRAFGLKGGAQATGVYFTYFSGQHIEIELWRLP